jgi:hypothetical protein
VVNVIRVLPRPCYPESHDTLPIWAYHEHPNLGLRTCYRPASFSFLNF